MRQLDRLALIGMILGVVIILQPWWADGLRIGFFCTLACTALHILTSHTLASRADVE